MSKPDTPATPDYTGAANATAAGNLEIARATAAANRPNYFTPQGSQVATQDPNNPDRWTITQTLSPDQQALFDQSERIAGQFGNIAESGLARAGADLAKGIDWKALPSAGVNPGQTGMEAILARLNPQLEAERAAEETRLSNQGINIGSKAYESAMGGLARQRNDAYTNAALQGISIGSQARQQALQEQLTNQGNNINLINAMRTGSQVSLPSVNPIGSQPMTQGADLNSAAANTYNANVSNANVQTAQNNQNVQTAGMLASLLANYYS